MERSRMEDPRLARHCNITVKYNYIHIQSMMYTTQCRLHISSILNCEVRVYNEQYVI